MPSSSTGPKWYEISRPRLAFEIDQLVRRYPEVELKVVDGELHAAGALHAIPEGIEAGPLEFDVVCRSGFPARSPKVKVVAPDLSREPWGHRWHLWSERNICFVSPSEWDIGFSLADVLDKVADWYYNYLAVKHGLAPEMPNVGRVQFERGGG